jgi:hypothetical protein
MLNSFLQILLFVTLPLPIALVFRGRADALLISPLIGFATAFVAGMLHLIFDVPIVFVWLLLIVSAYVWILRSRALRRRFLDNWKIPLVSLDYAVIIVGAIMVFGFIWRIPPPLGWDARSIWLFIASWLIEDSQVYVQVQQMPGVLHRGYPFGVPASIAVAWQLHGGVENLWSGVRLIAVLTLCASLLTVKTLLNHVVTGLSNGYQVLVALILTPVLFLVYGGFSRNGYMDPLLANLIALAAVSLMLLIQNKNLTLEERKWLVALTGLSLFCATSVKQEGIYFSLMLLIGYILVDRISSKRLKLALFLLPLGSFMVWKVSMFVVGSTDKGDASGIVSRLPEILDSRSQARSNYEIIIDRYFDSYLFIPTPLISIFGFAFILAIFYARSKASVRFLVFVAFVWLGNWLIILAPYMFGNLRTWLDGWLASSFDRIMTSQLLFTYIFAAYVLIYLSSSQAEDDHGTKEIPASGINA